MPRLIDLDASLAAAAACSKPTRLKPGACRARRRGGRHRRSLKPATPGAAGTTSRCSSRRCTPRPPRSTSRRPSPPNGARLRTGLAPAGLSLSRHRWRSNAPCPPGHAIGPRQWTPTPYSAPPTSSSRLSPSSSSPRPQSLPSSCCASPAC